MSADTMTMPRTRPIPLKSISLDGGTQPRAEIDDATVEDYADRLIACGDEDEALGIFPAVVVFHDGERHWLADGFHRLRAHLKAGFALIRAEVRKGTRRDAVLYSVGANADHGLRRTNADKRRAVETLLHDPEWGEWSNALIAQRCKVTDKTVAAVRREAEPTSEIPKSTVRRGADGRATDTARIGKAKPAATPEPEPDAEVAAETPARSSVNGVLSADPPDVARLRASGRIPAGATVEVHEPDWAEDGPEAFEPGAGPDEDAGDGSDEEFLIACPARAALGPVQRRIFDADALLYRKLDEHRKKFQHHATRALNASARTGDYGFRVSRFLKTDHPRDWLVCPALEFGGCGGKGEVHLIGKCPKCFGRGYRIK